MKFQINQCPLCGKVLKMNKISGVVTYYCDSDIKSHYEVETDGKITIQHIYAFPYAVDNFANSTRSRIYKWRDSRWKFVEEIPQVAPRPQNELIQHLRAAVPISSYPPSL